MYTVTSVINDVLDKAYKTALNVTINIKQLHKLIKMLN